jgi:hypothetical protein
MENALRGQLCYKGERGDSAYEVALKNGFIGSEKDFLAQLGTSSHFSQEKVLYTTTAEQTRFNLPENYTSNSFVEVYKNGVRLNSNEYVIDGNTKEVVLLNHTMLENQSIEVVVTMSSTNELPIVENINESSTNDTAPSTKAVYDYFREFINTIYPVGSIYMSANETSPETLFGGKWEQIKDRFLLGAGDTYAAGSIGGEESHKLELYEIPNHRHCILNHNSNGANLDTSPVLLGEARTGWEGAAFTSFEGGGLPHNNMPPYLAVHIWKRVS